MLHIIHAACGLLEKRLRDYAGLVVTEADAQAELHWQLLSSFPDQIPIEPGDGLLRYDHHEWPLLGARAYREISAGPSRATNRSDILILRNDQQRLMPKSSGAPARFAGPAACLIEVKLDVGRSPTRRIAESVERDFTKWASHIERAETDLAVAIIFTDRPSVYRDLDDERIIAVEIVGDRVMSPISRGVAKSALKAAVQLAAEMHKVAPLKMLREKDFETRILLSSRRTLGDAAGNACSQFRVICPKTNRLRPMDVAIYADAGPFPACAVEIKTSHSAGFKTLGRSQLEDEAHFLNTLSDVNVSAEVALFRYGSPSIADDIAGWSIRWPNLPLTYSYC